MLKILGAVAISAVAVMLSSWYGEYLWRRVREGRAFLQLIERMEGEIARYLTPPAQIFEGYDDPILERLGFLAPARTDGIDHAFRKIRHKLIMPVKGVELLGRLFSGFGRDYKDGELERLRNTKRALAEIMAAEESELPRTLKVGRVLICAAALGIIILII